MDTIETHIVGSFHAIVLGIVQGLTEFLPVSSSAHLILAPYFLKWEDPGLAFDVALHMGTLIAILLFFWRDWLDVLKQLGGSKKGVPLKLLVVGTIPAAIIGYLLQHVVEETFRAPLLTAVTLILFGLLLWYWDRFGKKTRALEGMMLKDALFVGLAQALALVPGVSRSGITITTALALGFTRPAAARFGFLLSAPIIAGAGLIKMKHIVHILERGGEAAADVGWGFAASLVSGLLAISLLSYVVKNHTYKVFTFYRLALGVVILVVVIVNR